MRLAERAPDLMQRLSRLPTAPQVALLHRRKPKPFTLGHKTPPLKAALYQMVLHRPVELAAVTGHLKY
jgi:hypothetical protein